MHSEIHQISLFSLKRYPAGDTALSLRSRATAFYPRSPPAGETIFPTATGKKESSDSRSESDFHTIIQAVGIRKYWYLLIAVLFGTAAVVLVRYGRFARPPALDLQNMEVTELTNNGKVREMAISPDGLSLAYARNEGLEQSLWLKRIDTGNETQLLTADTVNFSWHGILS